MSVAVSTPDADVASSGTPALTGGASVHAVLADINDATLVTLNPSEMVKVSFTNPTLPSGAVVRDIKPLIRAQASGATVARLRSILQTADGLSDKTTGIYVFSTQQIYPNILVGEYDPNSAELTLYNAEPATGDLKLTTALLITTYIAKPVVAVTAPSGTLTEDNAPTIEWSNTLDTDGGDQFAAEWKIFSAAQYGAGGFNPSSSTPTAQGSFFGSETFADVIDALPNATYRAYVRVSQLSNTSDWAYSGFVVNVNRPGVPTMTVTPEDGDGRIKIELDDNSGATTTSAFQVQRQVGGDWEDIRTVEGGGVVSGTAATIYDLEAPSGIEQTYRARAIHHFTSLDSFSDWTADADATLELESWWLKHPTDPSMSIAVRVKDFQTQNREGRVTFKQPLSRPDAVAIADTPGPETGSVGFKCDTADARDAVKALFEVPAPLLLQAITAHEEPDRWIVLTTEDSSRVIPEGMGHIPNRVLTYTWTSVARPEGDLVAWPS